MKNHSILLLAVGFSLMACDRPGKPESPKALKEISFTETEEALHDASNQGDNPDSTTYQRDLSKIDRDRAITKNIRRNLINDPSFLNAKKLRVYTTNGIVTLKGTVPSYRDKDHIANLVKSIDGVQGIDSRIKVSSISEE